jgi:hypothetical protein
MRQPPAALDMQVAFLTHQAVVLALMAWGRGLLLLAAVFETS